MKHFSTRSRKMFDVILTTQLAQAAVMNLKPGGVSGEFRNEHPKAEQWLYVVSGNGEARGNDKPIKLKAGSLLQIARREVHQIVNTGRSVLKTINFYIPPAYGKDDEPLPSVR